MMSEHEGMGLFFPAASWWMERTLSDSRRALGSGFMALVREVKLKGCCTHLGRVTLSFLGFVGSQTCTVSRSWETDASLTSS